MTLLKRTFYIFMGILAFAAFMKIFVEPKNDNTNRSHTVTANSKVDQAEKNPKTRLDGFFTFHIINNIFLDEFNKQSKEYKSSVFDEVARTGDINGSVTNKYYLIAYEYAQKLHTICKSTQKYFNDKDVFKKIDHSSFYAYEKSFSDLCSVYKKQSDLLEVRNKKENIKSFHSLDKESEPLWDKFQKTLTSLPTEDEFIQIVSSSKN